MDKKLKDLIIRSFDDKLSPEERRRMDTALETSNELRNEYNELLRLRETLGAYTEKSFQPFFADKVINRIKYPSDINLNIDIFSSLMTAFRPLAAIAAVAIMALAVYNISSGGFSIDGLLGIPQYNLDNIASAIH